MAALLHSWALVYSDCTINFGDHVNPCSELTGPFYESPQYCNRSAFQAGVLV